MKFKNILDSFYRLITNGRLGLNIGQTTGLPKLDHIITGIQRQTMYVIAGDTGSGKTSFCLYSYLYVPLKTRLGDKNFKVIYYSLEMTAEMLLGKLMSMYIYDNYGIVLSYAQIFSREEILSDEHYKILEDCQEWIEKVLEHLTIYDKVLTPKGLYANLKQYADENGHWVENENGTTSYIPNNPEELVEVMLDHLFLMRPGAGQTKKDMADEAIEYLISFRNKCGYSPIVIQQLNRQGLMMDRRKENMQLPELQDLKGTGGAAEGSEVVIALFNPSRQKMHNWEGYDIRVLKDRIRAICVLKNRFGEVDKAIPVNFFGEINYFRELPKAENLRDDGYGPYVDLVYKPEDQANKNHDNDENASAFVF